MKKIVLIIAMCVLQTMVAVGQIPYPPSTDTLPCGERQRNYFYSDWYDTTDIYLRPDNYHFTSPELSEDFIHLEGFGGSTITEIIEWKQQFAPRRIRIKGLWAMVKQYGPRPGDTIKDSTRLPEYLYLGLRAKDWPEDTYSMYGFLE